MWSLGLEFMLVVHGACYGNKARGHSCCKRKRKEIYSTHIYQSVFQLPALLHIVCILGAV